MKGEFKLKVQVTLWHILAFFKVVEKRWRKSEIELSKIRAKKLRKLFKVVERRES